MGVEVVMMEEGVLGCLCFVVLEMVLKIRHDSFCVF